MPGLPLPHKCGAYESCGPSKLRNAIAHAVSGGTVGHVALVFGGRILLEHCPHRLTARGKALLAANNASRKPGARGRQQFRHDAARPRGGTSQRHRQSARAVAGLAGASTMLGHRKQNARQGFAIFCALSKNPERSNMLQQCKMPARTIRLAAFALHPEGCSRASAVGVH